VGQPGEIHHQLPQGPLRRPRDEGERLRLFLAPETGRGNAGVVAPHVRQDVSGSIRRVLRLGHEPRLLEPGRGKGERGSRTAEVDGQRQPLRQRDGFLLERSGHEAREDQDRGISAAVLFLRRERGEHLELQPSRAVEIQGDRASRAVPARCGDHERAVFQGEKALPEGERTLPRSDRESHVGVRGEGRRRQGQAPGRSQGRDGDQRVLSR
jgi:hypothetical protein